MAKPDAPIMPEKAKKIRKYRNTRNDKTSLPKQVRDFIAAQESGSMPDDAIAPKEKGATLQELYDQGVIKGKRPKNMQEGGMAISDADIASVRRAFGSQRDGENTISDADRQRLQQFLADTGNDQSIRRMRQNRRRANESAKTISDADIARIMRSIGMEEGGEAVPAKFKGFSKLPEKVQQKMDPDLAQKYEKGGAVGSCRGMGAALRGGKFSGVK
tara:strand:- start:289 stop:936 length:648 start_codon:yes stop_codon:yes gene_type:complete